MNYLKITAIINVTAGVRLDMADENVVVVKIKLSANKLLPSAALLNRYTLIISEFPQTNKNGVIL